MLKIEQLLKGSTAGRDNNATFERPLDLLISCHNKILHFSSALLKLSTALKQDGWSDSYAASAEQIRRYFNVAGPEHHLDEELHLFPAIIALAPELKQAQSSELLQRIHQLIKEHVESDALWETLDRMLEERTENFAKLDTLASQFEEAMREHAEIENEIIFPYAKAHISDTEFKKMGADIAKRRGIKLNT